MPIQRRVVLGGMAGAAVAWMAQAPARARAATDSIRIDFGGDTPPAAGYVRAGIQIYTAERGHGWLSAVGLATRDRGGQAPERDFVFGGAGRVFRIGNLTPGRYRLTVLAGDLTFGDHVIRVQVPGLDATDPLPVLRPSVAQFATLTATLVVPADSTSLDLSFASPVDNWVVNAVALEPAAAAEPTQVTYVNAPITSTWGPILTAPDPTAPLLAGHRLRAAKAAITSTGLRRADYLRIITGEVEFWRNRQDTTGAIIDPYLNREFQYSTPAFAHAAATLVAYSGRSDLVEAAALALDWSAWTLAERQAASAHEDFFAPMIAHSIRLLTPFVPAARSARWADDIGRFEPFQTYRAGIGANNWNIVAASGEAMFQMQGLRAANHRFVEASFAAQGRHFDTPYGLYLEGPMAYDHFPRLWLAGLIARGYSGAYHDELTETLRRASLTSLFMQSPTGELPAGGRSAHHQWNEAEQCVTYEVFAAQAMADGDVDLAAYFKRAAHLALKSMFRWVRPSGEMQIIKHWMDPAENFAYEGYSSHSQYNLLPMSMLSIAFEHAAHTESVEEKPCPADVGGFVLHVEELHKVFANAGGTYVELDTAGDHHYDATGFIRAHFAGHSPQLGTSDSLVSDPAYRVPAGSRTPPTTGIGIAWETSPGVWRHFGELAPDLTRGATVHPVHLTEHRVSFMVRYAGEFGGGVTAVEETFTLTPDGILVTTVLPGYAGTVRRVAPLLSDDGRTPARIQVDNQEARVWQEGRHGTSKLVYRMDGASSVQVGSEEYPNHNGYMRLATGEYPAGAGKTGLSLHIRRQGNGRV